MDLINGLLQLWIALIVRSWVISTGRERGRVCVWGGGGAVGDGSLNVELLVGFSRIIHCHDCIYGRHIQG